MSNSRRHILRFPNGATTNARRQGQQQRLRDRVEQERAALSRWMARLRRAFHAVEKHQKTIARLERKLAQGQE
jgi:hypothetical protein